MNLLLHALAAMQTAFAGVETITPLDACLESGRHEVRRPMGEAGAVRNVAIVVGVQCYAHDALRKIEYAHADAELMADLLEQRGFQVWLLTGSVDQATIRQAIADAQTVVSSDGTFMFYYSGHGALLRPDEQVERYLLPTDATPTNASQVGVRVVDLELTVSSINAAHRAIILDTCYSGEGGRSWSPSRTEGARGLVAPMVTPVPATDAWLYASDFFQIAWEFGDLGSGHGAYTWFLTEALAQRESDLDGDGLVGLLEAHHHAVIQVQNRTSGMQVPQWRLGQDISRDISLGGLGGEGYAQAAVLVIPPRHQEFPLYIQGEDGQMESLGVSAREDLRAIQGGPVTLSVCWTGAQHTRGTVPCTGHEGILLLKKRLRVDAGEWIDIQPLTEEARAFLGSGRRATIELNVGMQFSTDSSGLLGGSRSVEGGLWWVAFRPRPASWAYGIGASFAGIDSVEGGSVGAGDITPRVGRLWRVEPWKTDVLVGPTAGATLHVRTRDDRFSLSTAPVLGAYMQLGFDGPWPSDHLHAFVSPAISFFVFSEGAQQPAGVLLHPAVATGLGLSF